MYSHAAIDSTAEVIRWRRRCEALWSKEARCPGCAVMRKLIADGYLIPPVCPQHQYVRDMLLRGG